MIVFLHFLNRELLRSAHCTQHIRSFDKEIKVCLAGTTAVLYSNYANLLEGGHLEDILIRELIKVELLHIQGEKGSLEEFWHTRTNRYSFDSIRYPYSQEISYRNIDLRPLSIRSFSMTSNLKTRTLKYAESPKQLLNLIGDIDAIEPFKQILRSMGDLNRNEAMTMSLASRLLEGKYGSSQQMQLETKIGELLSYEYVFAINEELRGEILTGIKGLGFYDQLADQFPLYDIPLIAKIFSICGIEILHIKLEDLISYRHSRDHFYSSHVIASILRTMHAMVNESTPNSSRLSIARKRDLILAKLNTIIITSNGKGSLQSLPNLLFLLHKKLCKIDPTYKVMNKQNVKNEKSFLIVTATNKESKAIQKEALDYFKTMPEFIPTRHSVVSLLGILNECTIFHVQCEAGSGGPASSQAVVSDLIDELQPTEILMPGIAFGLRPDEQKVNDLLVSTRIVPYEKERIGDNRIDRGDIVPATPLLISAMKTTSQYFNSTTVHFGDILSGEKLVDNPEFVKDLKNRFPEAIGGEMEGAGLYAAAYRKHKNWILVKSIVDWGMGKTDEHQIIGSSLAAQFLFKTIAILTK